MLEGLGQLRRRHPSRSSSHNSIPGSTLPERVAITSPSSGVNPIVVSSERPSLIAHSEAPGAQVAAHDPQIRHASASSCGARRATQPCESPWKP